MSDPMSGLKKRETRVGQTHPIHIVGDENQGLIKDMSVSGVYFETDSQYRAGSSISMKIELDGGRVLDCEGVVVRTETKDGKQGVAVRMKVSNYVLSEYSVKELPTLGIVRCSNPRSPKFGERVGRCEFSSVDMICTEGNRDYDREFGCQYAYVEKE